MQKGEEVEGIPARALLQHAWHPNEHVGAPRLRSQSPQPPRRTLRSSRSTLFAQIAMTMFSGPSVRSSLTQFLSVAKEEGVVRSNTTRAAAAPR
jgi:hypothetical protein